MLFGDRNSRFDTDVFQWRPPVDANIAEKLRDGLEQTAHLANRPRLVGDKGENLERRQQPVSGCRKVRNNDMARLLAAQVQPMGQHMLQHVAIANLDAMERESALAQKYL